MSTALPMGGQRAGRQIPDVEGGGGGSVGHWDRSGEGSGIRGGSSEFRGRPIARLNRIGNLRASVEEFLEFARRDSANGTPLEVVSGGTIFERLGGAEGGCNRNPSFPPRNRRFKAPPQNFSARCARNVDFGAGGRWWSDLVRLTGSILAEIPRRNPSEFATVWAGGCAPRTPRC